MGAPDEFAVDVPLLRKIAHSVDDRWERFTCRGRSVELSSAVIGNHHRLGAVLGRATRVVAAAHTFHHHRQSCGPA